MTNWESLTLVAAILSVLACIGVVVLIVFQLCCLHRKQKRIQRHLSSKKNSRSIKKHILEQQPSGPLVELQDEYTRFPSITMEGDSICIGVGILRQVSLSLLEETIHNLHNITTKLNIYRQNGRERIVAQPDTHGDDIKSTLHKRLISILKSDSSKVEIFMTLIENILTSTRVRQLLEATQRVCRITRGIVHEWKAADEIYVGRIPEENQSYMDLMTDDSSNQIKFHWDVNKFAPDFLTSVCQLLQALRDERRPVAPFDHISVHLAYHYLRNGSHVSSIPYRIMGAPGFRPHSQAYVALSDPGPGHILGTTRLNEWILGVVLQVEQSVRHFDTSDEDLSFQEHICEFSRVRLHVGNATPCSFVIGKVFSNPEKFDENFERIVHMVSAVVSSAFYQGAAECQISMEGLSISQALKYMQALEAEVHRDRFWQNLSAVWSIGQTVLEEESRVDKIEKALETIAVTRSVGFQGITIKSTDNDNQSNNVFTFEELLNLSHTAHSNGLLIYLASVSSLSDFKIAVHSGVDGIVLGSDSMLRIKSEQTCSLGPFKEECIPEVLEERDKQSRTLSGQGAELLARLDTMYSEGTISSSENDCREKLYTALLRRNKQIFESIIDSNSHIVTMPSEYSLPLLGTAKRLVNCKNPFLKECSETSYDWVMFVSRLKILISKNDESGIIEEYDGPFWTGLREKYEQKKDEMFLGYNGLINTKL